MSWSKIQSIALLAKNPTRTYTHPAARMLTVLATLQPAASKANAAQSRNMASVNVAGMLLRFAWRVAFCACYCSLVLPVLARLGCGPLLHPSPLHGIFWALLSAARRTQGCTRSLGHNTLFRATGMRTFPAKRHLERSWIRVWRVIQ